MKTNKIWVLSRMYAEFITWPLWEEKIILQTWPNGTDKLFAMRNYEVMSGNGSLIAAGTSSWLIVERTTKKIQRPDLQHERFRTQFNPELSPARVAEKIQLTESENVVMQHYKVRVSDLDINHHTNNVNYIRWVYDTYDLDFLLQNQPVSVEINYLAESVYGDETVIKTAQAEVGKVFIHSILRNDDNRELCRVKIVWKKAI
jgi:acyl-ACP thioesterase